MEKESIMHYKNGREAKEGDSAILVEYSKKVKVGQVHSITPGSISCNCQLAVILPGSVSHICATLGDMYHAEDALLAIEPGALKPQP